MRDDIIECIHCYAGENEFIYVLNRLRPVREGRMNHYVIDISNSRGEKVALKFTAKDDQSARRLIGRLPLGGDDENAIMKVFGDWFRDIGSQKNGLPESGEQGILGQASRYLEASDEVLELAYRNVADSDVTYVLARIKADRDNGPGYSIIVCNDKGEESAAPDLTLNEQAARRLFYEIYRGTVTPVTFMDVVEDWLAGR